MLNVHTFNSIQLNRIQFRGCCNAFVLAVLSNGLPQFPAKVLLIENIFKWCLYHGFRGFLCYTSVEFIWVWFPPPPFYFSVPWLVGEGQLGGMTEGLRYLSCRGESSLIGPFSVLGLLYGPLGAQLEGGNLARMERAFSKETVFSSSYLQIK